MFPVRTVGLLPVMLFLEGLLHLTENPLNLPGRRFNDDLGLQSRIVRQLSCFLFDLALDFVKLAFDLICGAWLHHGCSFDLVKGSSPSAIHRKMRLRILAWAEVAPPAASPADQPLSRLFSARDSREHHCLLHL